MTFEMFGPLTLDAAYFSALASIVSRLAAARVRAALFTDRRLQLPTLEVHEEGEGLLVRGVLHRPEENKLIQEAAVLLRASEDRGCRL